MDKGKRTMRRSSMSLVWFCVMSVMSIVLLPLCGCDALTNKSNSVDSSKIPSKAVVDAQLKEIDDNTHMPAQAKEAAKASILSHQNVTPAMGAGGGK